MSMTPRTVPAAQIAAARRFLEEPGVSLAEGRVLVAYENYVDAHDEEGLGGGCALTDAELAEILLRVEEVTYEHMAGTIVVDDDRIYDLCESIYQTHRGGTPEVCAAPNV